jgi:demethylmenaquinone methyltransferase/2-methoxy-6-polyprenyl-1,4-benzoquinol methylase
MREIDPTNRAPSSEVARMFDRISRTYDLLNHLLSLNSDRRWRRSAIRCLMLAPGHKVLDCGAGTGDMSLAAHRHTGGISTVLLDPAHAMLSLADSKAGIIEPSRFRLVRGYAERLPFADAAFDRFMVAFGIRNFSDLRTGLGELSRVLQTGGRGVILEFTPDRAPGIDAIFAFYMRRIMAPLGAAISGDRDAYRYLSRTVQNFATSGDLVHLLEEAGFRHVETHRLSLGVATLFVMEKR